MTFGGWGLGLSIFIGFIIIIALFLIGFLPVFYLSRHLFSNKHEGVYIKSKNANLIVSICLSLIAGYISYILISPYIMRLHV